MIQDLKERLEHRYSELTIKQREQENLAIKTESEKTVYSNSLEETKELLKACSINIDFDTEIVNKQQLLDDLTKQFNNNESKIKELVDEESKLNTVLLEQTQLRSQHLSAISEQYTQYKLELSKHKFECETQISNLANEINKLKNITDICPTCGQKIPNVIKPDTSQLEADLATKNNLLLNIKKELQDNDIAYNQVRSKIED